MTRRRYVYRANPETGEVESVEVGSDWTDAPISTGDLGKFDYDGAAGRTTDGVDISSRTKRREYMKATDVTDPRDWTPETREKVRAQRDAAYQGETRAQVEERKRDIYQAIQQVRRKRR